MDEERLLTRAAPSRAVTVRERLLVIALLGAAPLQAQNAELSGLTPTFSVELNGMNFFQDRNVDTVDRVL